MLTDKQIEREKVFCYDWYVTRKMDKTPTYADAIVWADKTMIEKACEWIKEHIDIPYEGRMIDGEPEAADYIEWAKERLRCAEEVTEAFRKAMEE